MNDPASVPVRNTKVMNRFDLTSRLVAKLKHEEAVIGGIGNTNFDLWAAGHRPQNFYMLGSMGLACPIALGVAMAQPQRGVIALEGDGSILMGLGCLATIADLRPRNLTIVIMDNALYQITGKQRTATGGVTDIVAVARVLRPTLEALGVAHHTLADESKLRFTVDSSIKQAVTTQAPVAFILSPLLTGGNPVAHGQLSA